MQPFRCEKRPDSVGKAWPMALNRLESYVRRCKCEMKIAQFSVKTCAFAPKTVRLKWDSEPKWAVLVHQKIAFLRKNGQPRPVFIRPGLSSVTFNDEIVSFGHHYSAKGPVSRILSCAVIPLGAALPRTLISNLPGGFGTCSNRLSRDGQPRRAAWF